MSIRTDVSFPEWINEHPTGVQTEPVQEDIDGWFSAALLFIPAQLLSFFLDLG